MTVVPPPEQGDPSDDSSASWQVALVDLVDRALGEQPRFLRLLALLICLLPLLAAVLYLAVNGLHGVLGLLRM